MSEEEWRDVVGYEGIYRVSSIGRVWSKPRQGTQGGYLTIRLDKQGRPITMLRRDGYESQQVRVHRVMALAFLGPCPPGMDVKHINGITDDNRIENLHYCAKSKPVEYHRGDHGNKKEECLRGHRFTASNTYIPSDGKRRCKECQRIRDAETRKRRRKAREIILEQQMKRKAISR
jgi:hypothetical protein